MEFFANVFLESCTAPTPHLLDFSVGVPIQGQCICAAAAEGVCVNSSDWYSAKRWVFEGDGCKFECCADMFRRDVLCPFRSVARREWGLVGIRV